MEVPSEVLQKLVCEICDGYLSRGPVHLVGIGKYRCGRCIPSEIDDGTTRIEAYEELAKLMSFPCRYWENGCTSKVPFTQNEAHEEACPFRKYHCPITESGKCEWTGLQTELLEHCQQDRPNNNIRDTIITATVVESSRIQHNIPPPPPPINMLESKVSCGECHNLTKPVYRRYWTCAEHAPAQYPCEYSEKGCTYSDINWKSLKHDGHYCQYSTFCGTCEENITTGTTLDSHYTQAR